MKSKLLYIICLVAGLLQACTNEVDDLFDSAAQQRLNEEIRVCKELLVSSQYGWKLDYYPSATQKYGGFAMTLKFDEYKVAVASEITMDATLTESSLYSVKADMGPTLNFDSYNSVLHYFSDPALSVGAGVGAGLEGDYEFIIVSHTDDEIILKGKKTRNVMRMVRLDKPSEEYLAPIMERAGEISSVMGVLGYDGQINGQQVSVSIPSDRRMDIQIGTDELLKTAFMYTATGIRFYQPLEIGGQTVEELEWLSDKQTWMFGGKELTPVIDPIYPLYSRYLGEYTMNYTYGNQAREVPVNIVMRNYTPTTKDYIVEGLPFKLRLNYNVQKDCMEFLTYTEGQCYFSVWEVTGSGTLSWGAGYGMVAKLRAGTDNVYDFVDNGVWQTNVARAIILWSSGGEYRGFGGDTRFQYIVLTKK